jgi:hypothetical protein
MHVLPVDFLEEIWYTKSIQLPKSSGHKLIFIRVGVYGFSINIIPRIVAHESGSAYHDENETLGAGCLLVFFCIIQLFAHIVAGLISPYSLEIRRVSQVPVQDRHRDQERRRGGTNCSLASIRPLAEKIANA